MSIDLSRLVYISPSDTISADPESVESAIAHFREGLRALGMECSNDHPSIAQTPERFTRYLLEFFQPFHLGSLLGNGFDPIEEEGIHGMVIQTQIPFVAICEHHLLPMAGVAAVAYVPGEKLVGLSKMSRLVEAYGHERPSLQEVITEKVASALFKPIKSKGSACIIKATHGCMSHRGIRASGAATITSCVKGVFRDVSLAREEFLSLANLT